MGKTNLGSELAWSNAETGDNFSYVVLRRGHQLKQVLTAGERIRTVDVQLGKLAFYH